jgi:arabinofuranosyltransferase
LITILACAVLLIGWRAFWFLTDDAYIAFRYSYNHMVGHGYVWNPAPFHPVEGYTSFLWVVLMEWIWRVTGVAPPDASNVVSLIFSFGSLLVGALMMFRLRWRRELCAELLIALALVGVLSNRTFLTWTSSGLETAMFNFFVLAWIYVGLYSSSASPRWLLLTTLSAAGIYLTRPDGLLFVGATLVLLALLWLADASSLRGRRLLGALPLLSVPLHVAWRRSFYGEWLPNSYFAKHTSAWPESGVRYAASFVLEYALWIWVLLGVAVLFHWYRRFKLALPPAAQLRAGGLTQFARSHPDLLRRIIVCSTPALHLSYYTFVIGGDHFEYRIYSYLVVLIFVCFLWMLNRLPLGRGLCIGLLSVQVVASWPIPWTHWHLSQTRTTREHTLSMWVPVSEHFPPVLHWYSGAFDGLQHWLIGHFVCLRHQEHKIASEWWVSRVLPSREEGLEFSRGALPVFFGEGGIGGLGWVLPRVNVIDGLGLNDYVIARYRGEQKLERKMAHERVPPRGYVSCFRPNVQMVPNKGLAIIPRRPELTASDVERCEQRWRIQVKRALP